MEITKNSATVGWVKPARNGGAKIDGYVIEYIEVKPPPENPTAVEVCHVIQYWNCHDTTHTLRSVTHNYHIYNYGYEVRQNCNQVSS